MTGATIDAVNNTIWTEYGPDPTNPRTPWFEDDILPRTGHSMNITIPTGLPSSFTVLQDENYVPRLLVFSDFPGYIRLPGGTNEQNWEIAVVRIDNNVAPYSPFPDKPASQNWNLGYGATLLWDKDYTYPQGGNQSWSLGPISYEEQVFTLWSKESRLWYGYSLETGELLWGPTASQPEWDMYGNGAFYAYGNLYSGSYGGTLYCYDIKTGVLKWTYEAKGIGYESPYGDYQITFGGVADGKIYIYSMEHSPTQPLWRGSYIRCLDAYDGTEIWKNLQFVSGFAGGDATTQIADGCLMAGNDYDNRMYVYGKGPSATTVTGPEAVQPLGTPVLIKGTVTDQSAGAKGTPAIADAYMDEWMEYLYKQQACPTYAEGVEVTLDAMDPNGNFIHIGTVTSDMSGIFSHLWTPENEGKYSIIATFAGSESYGSSYAETAVGVGPAVSPAQPIEPEPTAPTEAPLITTEVAIIAAVVVVAVIGIVAFWILRKRK